LTRLALGLLLGATLHSHPVPAEEARPVAAAPSEPASSLLADLSPEVWQVLEEHREALNAADAPAVLETIFQASTPYEFSGGSLVVRTDGRWFATLPAAGDGAALLELRRWPGDSVLAFYAVAPSTKDGTGRTPPVPGAQFTALAGAQPGPGAWEGWVATAAGDRPALWIERQVAEDQAWLGTLLLPGDAGLGTQGISSLTEEMMGVLRHVEIRPAVWKTQVPIPAETKVIVPVTAETPGDGDEELTPWQVARAQGFTLGLPPGFRARRMDGGVPPPRNLPGARLWFRGRGVDTDGVRVVVGDERRFGYVARVDEPDKAWSSGTRPPVGAPRAERIDVEAFALLVERSRAQKATAERWAEPGFAGQWLVFRMRFEDHGYEIGIPVLDGVLSPSLYWIAATWRDDGRPPAPPPIDPAERFGIKFERLTRADRQKQPWLGSRGLPSLRERIPGSLRRREWADGRLDDPYRVRGDGGTSRIACGPHATGQARSVSCGRGLSRRRPVVSLRGGVGARLSVRVEVAGPLRCGVVAREGLRPVGSDDALGAAPSVLRSQGNRSSKSGRLAAQIWPVS